MSTVQATREFTTTQMAAWLSANGFRGDNVVKVLFLGNSGSGKSFLCNALIGSDTFEHKTQAGSVTSTNTFVPVVIGGTAYVVCNIPGLIEADASKIARNKAAVEDAFKFLPMGLTVAIFVMSTAGGRVRMEDYQAIQAVGKYVALDFAATLVLVNNVDWERIDDDPVEYRAAVTKQVKTIVGPNSRVDFSDKVPKAEKSDYACAAMVALRVNLATNLRSLRRARMTPKDGAELVLEHERLKKDLEALRHRVNEQMRQHEVEMVQQEEKWKAEMAAVTATHEAKLAQMSETIRMLKDRPPQVIYVNRGNDDDDGCVVC
jgi:septin family protein